MTGDHITEPLDYLYEELSPEGMAEARRHLAACPECRRDMRAIRETVKLYRQADRPTPPPGLAERTAEAALAGLARPVRVPPPARDPHSDQAVVLHAPPPRTPLPYPDMEKEFARLKDEVMKDAPRGLRSWLFHPAWTVAASVIFICALLIHLSPRMRPERPMVIPAAPTRSDEASRQIKTRERIPPSQPRVHTGVPSGEPPPVLSEAEAINRLDLGRLLVDDDQPETGKFTITRKNPTALLADTPPEAFSIAPSKRVEETTVASGQTLSVRPEISSDQSVSPLRPEPAPASAPLPAYAAPLGAVPPPVPAEPAMARASAETDRVVSVPLPTDEGETFDGLIVEWDDIATPPEIVPRPTPLDVDDRIRTLTALVGMQIAHREWDDAWRTVQMVEAYNKTAAENLRTLVRTAQEAALEEPAPSEPTPTETAQAETEPTEAPEPEAPPMVPDPEPQEEPAAPEPTQPMQPASPAPAHTGMPGGGVRMTPVYQQGATYVAEPIVMPPIVVDQSGMIPRVVVLTPQQAAELHAAGRLQYATVPAPAAPAPSEEPTRESGIVIHSEPAPPGSPAERETRRPKERPKGFSTDPYVRGY